MPGPAMAPRATPFTLPGASIPDWWAKNGESMIKHMRDLGQMWDQRT